MRRTVKRAASCCMVVVVASLATNAGAQIEEIVVTAQKRTESIQEVPLSITVLTGEDIEARGLYDAQELARQVPNFDLPRFCAAWAPDSATPNRRRRKFQIHWFDDPGDASN